MGGWGRQGYLCCSIIPLRNLHYCKAYVVRVRVRHTRSAFVRPTIA